MNVLKLAAFSDGDTGGNPAGVVVAPEHPSVAEMQRIAAEVGFSETAFAAPVAGTASLWRVRFFAPAAGVNEDPVTGSAHCALGPYWSALMGKSEFTAEQISERGGIVRVSLVGDRVLLSGQAVTVLRGELSAVADPR